MRPADGPSNGSETLSRIQSLADYTIAMLESSFRKRHVSGDRAMPLHMGLFRLWQCILQCALILWIVRVAVAMTALGLLLLG